MSRIVRSIQSYHNNLQNHLQNNMDSKYVQNTNKLYDLQKYNQSRITCTNNPFLNVGIIQNVYNRPQKCNNIIFEEPKHLYHSSPKYGESRYTSSLVAGKMHKLTNK